MFGYLGCTSAAFLTGCPALQGRPPVTSCMATRDYGVLSKTTHNITYCVLCSTIKMSFLDLILHSACHGHTGIRGVHLHGNMLMSRVHRIISVVSVNECRNALQNVTCCVNSHIHFVLGLRSDHADIPKAFLFFCGCWLLHPPSQPNY